MDSYTHSHQDPYGNTISCPDDHPYGHGPVCDLDSEADWDSHRCASSAAAAAHSCPAAGCDPTDNGRTHCGTYRSIPASASSGHTFGHPVRRIGSSQGRRQ